MVRSKSASGDVDQDVDTAQGVGRGLGQPLRVRLDRHVGAHEHRAPAHPLDFPDQRLGGVLIKVGDYDISPLFGHHPRRRAAKTAGARGKNCHPVLEFHKFLRRCFNPTPINVKRGFGSHNPMCVAPSAPATPLSLRTSVRFSAPCSSCGR
jgi:hypothetical protein